MYVYIKKVQVNNVNPEGEKQKKKFCFKGQFPQ